MFTILKLQKVIASFNTIQNWQSRFIFPHKICALYSLINECIGWQVVFWTNDEKQLSYQSLKRGARRTAQIARASRFFYIFFFLILCNWMMGITQHTLIISKLLLLRPIICGLCIHNNSINCEEKVVQSPIIYITLYYIILIICQFLTGCIDRGFPRRIIRATHRIQVGYHNCDYNVVVNH